MKELTRLTESRGWMEAWKEFWEMKRKGTMRRDERNEGPEGIPGEEDGEEGGASTQERRMTVGEMAEPAPDDDQGELTIDED
jgi:hypothetical protein